MSSPTRRRRKAVPLNRTKGTGITVDFDLHEEMLGIAQVERLHLREVSNEIIMAGLLLTRAQRRALAQQYKSTRSFKAFEREEGAA